MSAIFYIIGWIAVLIGAWWLISAFSYLRAPLTSAQVLGTLVASSPGVGVLISGLLFMAIGGVLGRLDTIARYSRQSALTLKDILETGRASRNIE